MVKMQTMKFRKSRLVMLAVLLILVSSLGYWLMYASHPRSDLSQLHSHAGMNKHTAAYRHQSVNSRRTDDYADYAGLFRNRERNRVKVEAKKGISGEEGDERERFRRLQEAVAVHASHRESKQQPVNAERGAAELKADDDDKYDDSDDEDTVDPAKNIDTAAGVERGKEDDRGKKLPTGDNEYDDDEYDNDADDVQRPIEIDGHVHSSKNSRPSVRRDHEMGNEQLRVEGKWKKTEDVESVAADGNVRFRARSVWETLVAWLRQS